MKKKFLYLCSFVLAMAATGCADSQPSNGVEANRYDYPNIINIQLTPDKLPYKAGCFTDEGSWMGFTIPEDHKWVNGFCGPFSIDYRKWFAQSVAEVGFKGKANETFKADSTSYFPGEVYMESSSATGNITQRMGFVDEHTALLHITTNSKTGLTVGCNGLDQTVKLEGNDNTVTLTHKTGEIVQLKFQPNVTIGIENNRYVAETTPGVQETFVTISFFPSDKELATSEQLTRNVLANPQKYMQLNTERWNTYLGRILRNDMKYEYDRIAVKAIVTLLSNWRTNRGGLLHEGIVPSHAVHYFIGFWAWDSWRFSAALAQFSPELAKNNIRAMFDYQLPDGMIIDCIYTDSRENNARDSKPPLICWAVDEIFTHNNDTAFVKEMYPQLLSYYKWWFKKRDHDQNGMCEFGSTDGTLEAAAWESGMDNAIRFDGNKMLKNADDAWSIDQESVDLNSYLALECKLLKKFAGILGEEFDGPDYSDKVADYFFNPETNFFCDKKIDSRKFINDLGCEGYIPFWAKIATQEQMNKALPTLQDTAKFSTYIPFPTAAADNPKCDSNGYWRGPIWLDQTYFAIKGLRNYGYGELADKYTLQVFDRLEGLTGSAPIHENYGTHTGKRLQAPHFSWSSSHLLMMYSDYGK